MMIKTFNPGDIAKFSTEDEGGGMYIIIHEISAPLAPKNWYTNGETHFYKGYELIGDEVGAMVDLVVDSNNRRNWSREA